MSATRPTKAHRRRVVVTGLGAVTPVGKSADEYFEALLRSTNGIKHISSFDVGDFRCRIAGEITDFDPLERLEKREMLKLDRYAAFALYATAEAVEDAKFLSAPGFSEERSGVLLASGIGGIQTLTRGHEVLMTRGPSRVSPYLVPMMIPDIAGGLISIKYQLKGPNYCTVSACSSSSHAIGEGFRTIAHGYADVMVVGGAEASIAPIALAGFSNMRALSSRNDAPERASRPFDRDRDGFVMGEGAGVVVLEELSHAEKRGAKVVCEIVGYAATSDAHHITAPCPDGEGASRSVSLALADAGIEPDRVSYVNVHGTSTPLNDKMETLALKRALGDSVGHALVSSTKSMTGHLLGAAGGAEMVATALSIARGTVHPTRNLENVDPECDLSHIIGEARRIDIDHAISTSFGFGGHNATLVVASPQF